MGRRSEARANAEASLGQLHQEIAKAQAHLDTLRARLPAARALVRRLQPTGGSSSSDEGCRDSSRSRSSSPTPTPSPTCTTSITDSSADATVQGTPATTPAPTPVVEPASPLPSKRPPGRCPRCWYIELGKAGGKAHAWGTPGCDVGAAHRRRRARLAKGS